ncbi:Transcriptional regulator GlxA family, contains an amidase domain and an AraC-type DNA-binding HTH domain [Pseudomonas sp. NFR09]|uniref:DJ-1/PfpI family protein n=1 Tax=Pseudomonas sp. NFR09 TaxID=1566249 RepID=UPI0008B7EFA9|nr:DJ-1/PfpI family protein [Pseudomonas sp. NFR09]SET64562.1 Transcriptional regulator GlxA family, contains an amidase domain and an AraC-type DNA-binding HTH domain [Pseudomonas sp. NFR09]
MNDSFSNGLGRRDFLSTSLIVAGGLALSDKALAGQKDPGMPMPISIPAGPKLKIAMLVHPRMVLLDLVGPQTVFNIIGSDIYLVAKTLAPVSTDVGIDIVPDMVFDDCPHDLDVLFVPGGLMGSLAAMQDETTLQFLADRGQTSKYVTSVCTGALVIGAAGLLTGYRANTHWGVADLLPLLGATLDHSRVVHDRNRMTGGGVTAGIDFGLTLAAILRGEDMAKHAQLIIEYAPEPPFHAGTPQEVGPAGMIEERKRRVWMDGEALRVCELAAKRLRLPQTLLQKG